MLDNRQIFTLLLNSDDILGFGDNLCKKIDTVFNNIKNKTIKKVILTDEHTYPSEASAILKNINVELKDNKESKENIFIYNTAPLKKIYGCWLNNLVSLNLSRYDYGSTCLRIHSKIYGNAKLENSYPYLFEQYANSCKVRFGKVYSLEFSLDDRISQYSFEFPVFLLSISQFPDKYEPELLGINLYLNYFLTNNNFESYWNKEIREDLFMESKKLINEYLNFMDNNEIYLNRILSGFHISDDFFCNYLDSILNELSQNESKLIENEMVKILGKVGHHAHGYHKKGKLGGKNIDDWFNPDTFNSSDVLVALSQSKYISPGKPEESLFVKYISTADERMFGIFNNDEINKIRKWIENLSEQKTERKDTYNIKNPKIKILEWRLDDDFSYFKNEKNTHVNINEYDLKKMYYDLLKTNATKEIHLMAKSYVSKILNKSRTNLYSSLNKIPFDEYSHSKFEKWLNNKHKKQVNNYTPLIGKPEETKEEVISQSFLLAPLILIDGAWLRKFTNTALLSTEIGLTLYKIYIDELGNGIAAQNHGNIYGQLLKSMGINIDEFTEMNFINDRRFSLADFKLPVYWLSLSLFPRTFYPEILGLNLAMELSGIGNEYRKSGEILKYYGFSNQFTTLHNTIDNIVSGHTALASNCIKLHMDNIYQEGGSRLAQEHWQRIWIGYISLNMPKKKLMFNLNKLRKSKVYKYD